MAVEVSLCGVEVLALEQSGVFAFEQLRAKTFSDEVAGLVAYCGREKQGDTEDANRPGSPVIVVAWPVRVVHSEILQD